MLIWTERYPRREVLEVAAAKTTERRLDSEWHIPGSHQE